MKLLDTKTNKNKLERLNIKIPKILKLICYIFIINNLNFAYVNGLDNDIKRVNENENFLNSTNITSQISQNTKYIFNSPAHQPTYSPTYERHWFSFLGVRSIWILLLLICLVMRCGCYINSSGNSNLEVATYVAP